MKRLIIILLLLIPLMAFSQIKMDASKTTFLFFGPGIAYNFSYNPQAVITAGIRLNKVSTWGHLNISSPTVCGFSAGYNLGPIQPFIDFSDYTKGKEANWRLENAGYPFKNRWAPGAGLAYYMQWRPIKIYGTYGNRTWTAGVDIYWTL